ncbi:MAG TPA: TlpA disulfide reductase family protein [Polyangiales bacterium]|nr:TlpA disulfide reductase family protein [Polyangiales bacterium]
MTAPAVNDTKAKNRELWAALLVLILGAPFVFVFARAMADGEVRRREGPLRAMLGDQAFNALSQGQKTEMHYLGDGLLAPDFTLEDKDGKPWRLKDQRGKIVVMNFWTITCQPCVEEMPSLITLADIAKKRKDIELVAITSDKDWATVAAIFPPRSNLKILFDPSKKVIKEKYGSKLFPETWVIDGDGVVRMRVDGPRDWGAALSIAAFERFM